MLLLADSRGSGEANSSSVTWRSHDPWVSLTTQMLHPIVISRESRPDRFTLSKKALSGPPATATLQMLHPIKVFFSTFQILIIFPNLRIDTLVFVRFPYRLRLRQRPITSSYSAASVNKIWRSFACWRLNLGFCLIQQMRQLALWKCGLIDMHDIQKLPLFVSLCNKAKAERPPALRVVAQRHRRGRIP